MAGKKIKSREVKPLLKEGRTVVKEDEKASTLKDSYKAVSEDNNLDPDFLNKREEIEKNNQEKLAKKPNDNKNYNREYSLRDMLRETEGKKSKAPGKDAFTYNMVNKASRSCQLALLRLYNRWYNAGIVPPKFKHAVIAPVPKPGKPTNDPASYRPISLTSQLGKIYESMCNTRLAWYIESNGLLNDNQAGFRRNRGTTEQIVRLDSDVKHNKRKRRSATHAAFLDLEKAYDIMWRNGVLLALDKREITGQMFNFVKDFLSDRTFQVKVGNCLSEEATQENGTPQGAVISPLLFNLLIDDINEPLEEFNANLPTKAAKKEEVKVKLSQYADDIALWRASQSRTFDSKLLEAVELTIRKLRDLGFKVNEKKTQIIKFYSNNNVTETVNINGQKVKTSNSIKFLGVTFDRELTYREHIINLANKARKTINILRFLKGKSWGANTKILRTLYMSLVRSQLCYGQEVFDAGDETALESLEKIQGQAAKVILGAPKTMSGPCAELLLKLPPIKVVRATAILNFWKKIESFETHPLKKYWENFQQELYNKEKDLTLQDLSTDRIGKLDEDDATSALRGKQLEQQLGLEEDKIETTNRVPKNEPWALPSVEVDISLTKQLKKKEDSEVKLKQTALEHIDNHYKEHHKIYTDGSKRKGKTGAAAIFPSRKISQEVRLNSKISTMSIELTAINLAIENIICQRPPDGNYVIFTDSLASALAIKNNKKNTKNRKEMIDNIGKLIENRRKNGQTITICWIPAHCGIAGNESADLAAKNAAEQETIHNINLSTSEMKALIKFEMRKKLWQKLWEQEHRGRFLFKSIKTPNYKEIRINTEKDRKFIRMLAGKPFFHPRDEYTPFFCDKCKQHISIDHALVYCSKNTHYTNAREQFERRTNIKIIDINSIFNPSVFRNNKSALKDFITSLPVPT